ncbi:MAG: archease [Nanoarchaeota archaeon]
MVKASYKYLEHTADVLFMAEAGNLPDLFIQCGLAVEDAQVNLKKVKPVLRKRIKEKNSTIEKLLFDFLDDLLFYKDSEQLIFSKFEMEIKQRNKEYELTCTAFGEKLNPEKHEFKVDVKAITMHMFEVELVKGRWKAQVLIDI